MGPEQVFFGEPRPRLGWISRPDRARETGLALVFVPPFGFEEVCAHRALRTFAEQAATAGHFGIRFDLDGTGDSAGDDLEPDRLAAWLASIDDACELARGSGADRIALVGVRLGATLAALAAARRTDVVGLVAIAAAAKPKALLRELYALQTQLELRPAPPGVAVDVQPNEEVAGFAITPATRAELAAIDLTTQTSGPAPRVLVIDRDDQKGNDAWVAALRGRGIDVEHVRLGGYVDLVADPHRAKPPIAMIDATLAFAATLPRLAGPPPPARRIAMRTRVAIGDVEEELVAIDDAMFAIVTRPSASAGTVRRSLVLISSGATHRIGPGRMYVDLARRLAARGVAVVRVDISGIGDAANRIGAADNVVYSELAFEDTRVIATWAKRAFGGEVAMSGLCSGGFHALRASLDGQPVDLAIPINTPVFAHEVGKPLDFGTTRATSEAQRYRRAITQTESWKKLARGEVDVVAAAKVAVRRLRDTARSWAKDVARRTGLRDHRDDLPSEMRELSRRGGRLRFIFASDDPGRAVLEQEAGSALQQLVAEDRVRVLTIAGADHTFTARWARAAAIDAIVRAVVE